MANQGFIGQSGDQVEDDALKVADQNDEIKSRIATLIDTLDESIKGHQQLLTQAETLHATTVKINQEQMIASNAVCVSIDNTYLHQKSHPFQSDSACINKKLSVRVLMSSKGTSAIACNPSIIVHYC
jgi:hypothetical protein